MARCVGGGEERLKWQQGRPGLAGWESGLSSLVMKNDFLKQRCNKITSTLRKLAGIEITNRRPTDWTGPAGRLGLVPTYFVLNRFFHDGDLAL